MIDMQLPYPVSSNAVWARTKTGMRKSSKYTAWLIEAGQIAKHYRAHAVVGKYNLYLAASRPDNRKRDIDNLIGSVSDLLVSCGLVRDDSDCELVSARWVTAGEGVNVRVERAVTE